MQIRFLKGSYGNIIFFRFLFQSLSLTFEPFQQMNCRHVLNMIFVLIFTVAATNTPIVIGILVIAIVLVVVLLAIARVKGMLCFAGKTSLSLTI